MLATRRIGRYISRRRLSLALITLLLVLGIAIRAAGSAEAEDGQAETSATNGASPSIVKELPGQRTATSNTFELSNGSLETRIYETPVNYRDEEGDWQPIEQALRETPTGALTNGDSSFDVHLPEDLAEAPIKVSMGEQWVSEEPLGIQTNPAQLQNDGVASYSTESGDAGFEFTGLANGLKETIELADSLAPSTYHFKLDASASVNPHLAEDGSIAFRDEEGELVAEMPAPFMVDSAGIFAPPGAVEYRLEAGAGQTWNLAVETDPQWLAASERSWPVIIDPSVTIPAPSQDCIIATDTSAQMCGNLGFAYLAAKAKYPSTGSDAFARTLLRFGTGAIPKTASLSSATVELYSAKTATNVTRVDLYDVNKNWNTATTWTLATGSNPWAAPGGDFGKLMPSPASVTTAQRGSQPGLWSFSNPGLASLVETWRADIAPNKNYGVLLKLADETPHVCCFERRVEWESSAGANKPRLSVQYILPASADSKVISPTDGTKTAKRFLLKAGWDHTNVEGVTFQYKTGNMWSDIPTGQVIDEKNQTVTWPLGVKVEDRESESLYWDASGLADSKGTAKVKIRAVLSGSPGASGYTKPVEAELDQNVGGDKDAAASIGPGSVDLLTGNFTVSRTDASVPGFNSSFQFSRSISSREPSSEQTGVLGQGWRAGAPVEEAGGSAWRSLKIESKTEEEEGETRIFNWAALTSIKGETLNFDIGPNGEFITPPEMSGTVLYRLNESQIAFSDPDGNRTVFSNSGSGNEYWPISVAQAGGPGNKTRMIYEFEGEKRRLKTVIAPTAEGLSCSDEGATTQTGCRVLAFTYKSATDWGAPASAGKRLSRIQFYAPGLGGPWEVAKYAYDTEGRLTAAWDPRISPALKETYAYEPGGQLKSITPPGQEPWTMNYGTIAGEATGGRLMSVQRASLDPGHPVAQTTIAYGVPLSGTPYDMSPSDVAKWGQEDLPADATAIFPPDEVPASPPSSYARAIVYYMDAEGQTVNVATPPSAGASGPSISTMETDVFGNVSRELSPENRLRALAVGTGSIAKSRELDTQFGYSSDGTELQEEKGPVHTVRLETGPEAGTTKQARSYRSIQYDKGAPEVAEGEAKPYLPTHETTGALVGGKVLDQRTVEYEYEWKLRQRIASIVDPEGAKVRSVTAYDPKSSLPVEVRQPKDAETAGAGTTKIVYYKPGTGTGECEKTIYAGLPCKVEPAVQPGTPGLSQLLVKKFLSYNQLGQPLEITESPGGGSENVRKTVRTYDAAGRRKTGQTTGGGTAIPKIETLYNSTLGLPTTQRFVCPESEPGCDTQATTTTYDALGRATSYEDADGVKSTTTYDFIGRPAIVNDGKGTQTYRYDSVTGFLVELEDSAAGIFTASYDADGHLVKRGLPNGLTALTTYDETGSAVGLTYTKASNCGLSCTWLNFALDRSARGQILVENSTLGKDEYSYDTLGRLVSASETPSGGSCTTRSYTYDSNSNRMSMTTNPGVGGVCSGSGGTPKNYSYDGADRLLAEGLTYDSFGRTTNLPAALAGGKALSTTYFANNMVATQSQNGVTNTFQLDGTLRQRQRFQAGGLEGTEVFHYAGPGDAPAWTERGAVWTRNIVGIGGELAAVQESGKEITLPLTNLHGDVVATAAINPEITALKGTSSYDEFGNPTSGTTGRFGWLGGMQRRTELPAGIVQMGARSYVPVIGRFLSTDPIAGGSANAYDYGNADPVNQFDPSGMKPHDNDCDPGYVFETCQVWLHIKMWSPRGGRMGVRMIYKSNRAGGIRRISFSITYWRDDHNDIYKEGFVEMSPPHYLNSYPGLPDSCRASDPCAQNHDGRGTFACEPGDEYQIQIIFKYRYNVGDEIEDAQLLEVKAQEFCRY